MMLACQVHLGTKNVDFKMQPYVWKRRSDGIHILDINKTWQKLVLAARIVVAIENPKDVCAIAARPYGQRAVHKFAKYTGAQALAGRYTPGTFTNQIQKVFMEPRVLVVTDPRVDHQSVREASYVNIPVIAFTNSDSPLRGVDVAVPCNNRNKTSLALMWWMLTREVLRLRGTIPRSQPWDVMVDMFIYRDPEEEREQERLAAEEKKREAAHEAAEAFDQQEEWPETAAFVPTENWGDAPAGATAAAAGGWSQSWDQAAPK